MCRGQSNMGFKSKRCVHCFISCGVAHAPKVCMHWQTCHAKKKQRISAHVHLSIVPVLRKRSKLQWQSRWRVRVTSEEASCDYVWECLITLRRLMKTIRANWRTGANLENGLTVLRNNVIVFFKRRFNLQFPVCFWPRGWKRGDLVWSSLCRRHCRCGRLHTHRQNSSLLNHNTKHITAVACVMFWRVCWICIPAARPSADWAYLFLFTDLYTNLWTDGVLCESVQQKFWKNGFC